jgi:hypothetical protein
MSIQHSPAEEYGKDQCSSARLSTGRPDREEMKHGGSGLNEGRRLLRRRPPGLRFAGPPSPPREAALCAAGAPMRTALS